MRMIDNQGVRLATQAFGQSDDPALLLIMGATESMLGWPDELCVALAGHGFHVLRFDHRDTGQSTTVPPGNATYAVEDLAGDAIAILDAYGIERAHVTGMSLGGYIGQMLAVTHPQRIASLTLIASEPLGWDGDPLPHISQDFLDHFAALSALDWSDRAAVKAFLLQSQRLCAGNRIPFDHDRESARLDHILSRTTSIASMFNHGTLTTRDDWAGRFRQITCPVLVIHGEEDPILPVQNGMALAEGIPGATLRTLPGIGHEIPQPVIPEIAALIAGHAGRAPV